MAKKRSFKKLREHLTSDDIDKKIEYLESRMPTNNTAFVFQGDPSNPQGNSFETIVDGEENETDYSVGESPTSYTEARDTSGLFNVGGDHALGEYVKTEEPPGDTSYILGPMAAMYYTWSYPWTMIGYIRESDRRMVNLARIDGKLSDWDQSSGFSSYGQITLEQAKWFYNIAKANGNTNDPATYSYRAYYPGPPSAVADAYGRYPCILTGVSKKQSRQVPNSTPLDKQAGDNFSAIQALIKQFKKDGTLQSIYKGGKLVYDKAKSIFSDKKARANANISAEDEKFLRNQQTLVNLTKGLGLIGLPNDFAQWTINYAKGDMTPITKFSPGMERQVRDLVLDKFKKNPGATTVDIQYGDYGYGFKALPTRLGLGRFNATKLPNGKIRIQDTFNVDKDFTNIGSASIVPGLQNTADRLVDISYKTRNIEGRTDEAGITIDVEIKGDDVIPKYQQNRNNLNRLRQQQSSSSLPSSQNQPSQPSGPSVSFTQPESKVAVDISNIEVRLASDAATNVNRSQDEINADKQELRVLKARARSLAKERESLNARRRAGETVDDSEYKNLGQKQTSPNTSNNNSDIDISFNNDKPYDPFANELKPDLKVKPGDELALGGVNYDLYNWYVKTYGAGAAGWYMNNPGSNPKNNPFLPGGAYVPKAQKKTTKKSTMVAHYQSGRKSLIEIRKPTILPETKQKSYKVSPGQRYRNKNKKPEKTNFQGMDKLFNKYDNIPQPFKPQERTSWTKDFIKQNIMQSQEKMNNVLELVGDGKFALHHAMNDYKRMGAKELEQYWGRNPYLYNFYYNNKNYKVTRKEQVEGDFIVFLEDQSGQKINILQSELNEKIQEEKERWLEEMYYRDNPVVTEKGESMYDTIKRRFMEKKDIAPEFPEKAPPKMINGFHPEYGKRADRYKKLDPASANAMPETGDPETDEIVRKQKTINKIKSMRKKA